MSNSEPNTINLYLTLVENDLFEKDLFMDDGSGKPVCHAEFTIEAHEGDLIKWQLRDYLKITKEQFAAAKITCETMPKLFPDPTFYKNFSMELFVSKIGNVLQKDEKYRDMEYFITIGDTKYDPKIRVTAPPNES